MRRDHRRTVGAAVFPRRSSAAAQLCATIPRLKKEEQLFESRSLEGTTPEKNTPDGRWRRMVRGIMVTLGPTLPVVSAPLTP
jgi:hypothetical protein